MATNTRWTIIEAIKSGLEAITKVNSYQYDVQSVEYQQSNIFNMTHAKTPALVIIDSGDTIFNRLKSGDYYYNRAVCTLQIVGIVKSSDDVFEVYQKHLVDLRKCVLSLSLGDNVYGVRYLGDTQPYVEGDGGKALLYEATIAFWYYYQEDSP